MKMIFKVAKAELKNLFYSPVAWFLAVAFMIQCAVYYCNALVGIARWQDVAQRNMPKFKDFGIPLTAELFMGGDSIFRNALQNLYLFIPLLTMGLISREVNNGTIKLLYSSPVKTRQIVLGKFLAMLLYNALLVMIIGIFMVMVLVQVRNADYGLVLSGILAFYLLVCTYAAIGLFMSSLTNYQIVAAIGSFIVILILSRIGGLWQKYEFVRDLTYFLSISGRTVKMLKGLITTKDVIYFGMITVMFVAFTIIKMKAGRESKPWLVHALRYSVVALIVLLIGYVSSRPVNIAYWDATAGKYNTLHPNVQKVVKEMNDGPLEITLYTNLLGGGVTRGFPENRNEYLTTLWEPYQRFKPDIKFKYVYYYDVDDQDSSQYRAMPGKTLSQIAEQVASGFDQPISLYKAPAEVRKMINLQPEKYRLVMDLQYKGRHTFLRTFDGGDFWPDDEQVAPALKKLIGGPLPKLTFLTGNLERDIYKKGEREYQLLVAGKDIRQSLVNLGFESDTLSAQKEIRTDIATLVLADPKTALDAVAQAHIRDYINKGGNMLVLGEPGKQDIVNPILQQLGVQLGAGTLIEITPHEAPNMVKPYLTKMIGGMAQDGISQVVARQLLEGDTMQPLNMAGAVPVLYNDTSSFTANTLMATMKNRDWLKKGLLVADSTTPIFNAAEGDSRDTSYVTALTLSRKIAGKEQRIIVCGDADFMSSSRQRDAFLFGSRAMFAWLNNGAYPIYAPQVPPKDTVLQIHLPGTLTVRILFVWVIPALVALLGMILLLRRKRQ